MAEDTLGSRVKVLRAMSKTSQRDLATVINKSNSTMSLIETGVQDPSASQIEALASFLAERLGWSQGRVLLYLFGIADMQINAEVENFRKAPSKAELPEVSQMPCDVSPAA